MNDRMRRLRFDRGLSQTALAERSGLTAETIRRVESEITTPMPDTAFKIARVLGVSPSELFLDNEDSRPGANGSAVTTTREVTADDRHK